MSSSDSEDIPTGRLDIMEQQRKRQQKIPESMDWRSTNNNRIDDSDANFKMLRDAKAANIKEQRQTLPTELEPISRQEADKLGISYQEMERRNIVNSMKRNQYLAANRRSQR